MTGFTPNCRTLSRAILLPTVIVALLVCAPSMAEDTEGEQDRLPSRCIQLDGQPNLRDLGGYDTADGHRVKRGLIYRSGELSRLSDDDVQRLEQLQIRTVVNFLTPEEIDAKGKDRLPDDVKSVAMPIAIDGLAVAAQEAIKTGDFSKLPANLNFDVHRVLVRDAREQFAGLLRELADPTKRPLVFHCSHGVHRTGVTAAIVLSVLGVPWETVREDYLLSNITRHAEVEMRLKHLRTQAADIQGVAARDVDMTNIRAFYVLEAAYIDAALDEINDRYGCLANYVSEGLGISDAEVERLRRDFLESPPR